MKGETGDDQGYWLRMLLERGKKAVTTEVGPELGRLNAGYARTFLYTST